MGYLYASEVERCNGITEDTHKKHDLAWRRWVTWLGKVGLDSDPYLLRFNGAEKVRLVGGFAVSIRRGEHSAPRHEGPLVSGTSK